MNQTPSSEFQRTYQRLTEPTEVTAHGRVIGKYYPTGTEPAVTLGKPVEDGQGIAGGSSFGYSRPAPKPTRKK